MGNQYNNNNNNAHQEKNYGIKNQYHPKSSEELYDQRKAHIYQMKGSFDAEKGVLNVYVYDAMTKNEWEENFTQKNFQNLQLSEVGKATIEAINTTMKGGGTPMVTVREWNNFAYITFTSQQHQ